MYSLFKALSVFLLVVSDSASDSSSDRQICSAFSCGRVTVSYPFWTTNPHDSSNPDSFCGYRDLKVTCQDDVPRLRSRSGASFILRFLNQAAKSVRLVDPSVDEHAVCPIPWHNITIMDDFPDMSYSPSTTNLHFFLDCPSLDSYRRIPNENQARCLLPKGAGGNSYVFVEGDSSYILATHSYCRNWTRWPVLRELISGGDVASTFAVAMREGFDLQWSTKGDGGQCSSCELSNGRCVYTDRTDKLTFRCRCPDDTWSSGDCFGKGEPMSTRSKLAIGVPGFCLILGFVGVLFYVYAKQWKRRPLEEVAIIGQTVETFLEMNGPIALKRYKYSEVKRMSNSFQVKLGTGGYGTVYKGKLPSGISIAIKVLTKNKANGEEFLNEVVAMGRTSHKNVVSLLGFCFEGRKRALIYEFMANGSLEKFLFHNNMNTMMPLAWDQLYKIAIGIARGLEYLHRGCKTSIVHFDIKPHNILLDEEFSPKISDFGLAQLCPHKQDVLSIVCARGTIGYIAPELFSPIHGHVSSKSDVYSYGMLILEMVGRRRNFNVQVQNSSEIYFPHWVYDHFSKQKDLQTYGIILETEDIAKKMIIVGLWCIQKSPASRPSIRKVVEMLEGDTKELQLPPKPYLYSPPRQVIDSYTVSFS